MMTFVKTHLISLASGVAALAFIVVGVLGMMQDDVITQMQDRTSSASKITSLMSTAKNQAWIDAEEKRSALFKQEYDATLEAAKRFNERKPLLDAAFPRPASDAVAYDFRDAYRRAIGQLPHGKLSGGDRPTDREIADAAEDIREYEEMLRDEGDTVDGPVTTTTPRAPTQAFGDSRTAIIAGAGIPVMAGVGSTGRGMMPSINRGSGESGAKLADPTTDAFARAAVTKARSIRCYASTEPGRSSFQISPVWNEMEKPTADKMWYAQVGLWLQRDIVNAIAELNDKVAQTLPEEERDVAHMPVKRIRSIDIEGYIKSNGVVPFDTFSGPGFSSNNPAPVPPDATFTGRTGDDQFDVVRFRVDVVVDQRDVLKLVDAITRQNFYTLTEISTTSLGPDAADVAEGYLYGPAPVVRAEMNFEGYMARSVFEQYFPKDVRIALGIDSAGGGN